MKINGITGYLWRAVDQHGNVLDVLVRSRRNAKAAKRFFRKLLKGLRYVPRVLVTDKLASYVAHRQLMGSVAHRRSRYLNNRAENSHQRTRQRERAMKRFKSVRHAQRFLSAFSAISAHFRPRRHRLSATQWRTEIDERFAGTVNLSNPRAIFAGSPPRFTRSRVTHEAYVVSRTSTRPQVDSAVPAARIVSFRAGHLSFGVLGV